MKMDSADQYLQADLTLDLLDQLREIESSVLAFEAGQPYGGDDALVGSAEALRDAARSAESLGLKNVECLTCALASGVELLPKSGGSLQPHRIGAVLTAIDTLFCLLENVDCSDEFDINGQLSVLSDCTAVGGLDRYTENGSGQSEKTEYAGGKQRVVRRFDVPAGSPNFDPGGLELDGCANREKAGAESSTALPGSAGQLFLSYE